ncbi:reticulon-4-interacting protein 1 homolog, mitochondrial [Caerostris darwini]|uniref:Reticulon-4-interacting protein 1 homolog, mitochondrial n=1 Tax=Caerostris darwini TaxID=1538125 RepID=A0AAV4Q5M4_9ARAC|nr:reticulon-4-interacting protein 1 homolog, mitochondrial [Caerostris darwini]
MDFKLRMSYLDALSPSVLFGMAGIATIAAVGSLHLLISRSLKLLQNERKRRKVPCMKGVVIRSYGGISSIEVRTDLPIPKILKENEVLIKVIAAGLDNIDLLVTKGYGRCIRSHIRENNEHVQDESKIIMGRECSGIVLNIGKDVTTVSKGDEVWAVSAYCLEGLMAEYVVIKENQVALKPKNLTFEAAASMPYTAIQACNALVKASLNSKSTKGKRILLVTGNSPVGLFAMQLLKSWGGDVTTAVPTAGLPMCHELGADDVIVYTVTDFETELRKRKKFDIVLNAVGTIIHQLCVDVCSPGGKVITFTTTPILSDKFDVFFGSCLAMMLQIVAWIKKLKQGMLTNFWWDNFSYDKEYLYMTSIFVEEEKIFPIVERIYEVEEASIAFQQLAKYENVGKNVLRFTTYPT